MLKGAVAMVTTPCFRKLNVYLRATYSCGKDCQFKTDDLETLLEHKLHIDIP
jgi:hypothetical protein